MRLMPFAYPRPRLRRKRWTNLNGTWAFAIDADARWKEPAHAAFNQKIEVPFAPETTKSGISVRPNGTTCKHCIT